MQQFCRELCYVNNHFEEQEVIQDLRPPESWTEFFSSQVDRVAERWFFRLLRGPQQRGNARKKWPRKAGGTADNYALIMEALTLADPGFEISKDEIKTTIENIVDGPGPAGDQTTKALKQISGIAARPIEEELPGKKELESESQGGDAYILEYVDQGPNSRLHITDPFFAYYLRWGAKRNFTEVIPVINTQLH